MGSKGKKGIKNTFQFSYKPRRCSLTKDLGDQGRATSSACVCTSVSLYRARSCGAEGVGHQGTRVVPASQERQHVPAPGAGLWPRGWGARLKCPEASNWGDWDPGTELSVSSQLLEGIYLVHIYTHTLTSGPPPYSDREGSSIRLLLLLQSVFLYLPDLCGQTCIHVYVMYTCALCACAYQEYIFSLITGYTWGHRAAAASSCWIQQSIFPLTNSTRNNYTN